MNTTATHPILAALAEPSTVELRTRYEGSNIATWIGFKHVNYLVEEAVLEHLRRSGLAPAELYHRHGLCVDVADIDTRILHAFHMDDLAVAEVVTTEPGAGGRLRFAVTMRRTAGGPKAVAATVVVALREDPGWFAAEPPESWLAPLTTRTLGEHEAAEPIEVGDKDIEELLTGGRNAFLWKWRIPYFYCHFTERLQMSGYLRQLEEVVDLFLADRGVSIKTLLDEQHWIPVVPHSRVTLLGEALMEEELYTLFTVEEVFKRLTYTSRMDTYVLRDGLLVPTATGRITHGYASIDSRADWSLVSFDDRLLAALSGGGRRR